MEAPNLNRRLDSAWPHIVRYTGLAIVLYETVFERVDRPSLLLLAAGMIGLKNVLDLNKAVKENKDKDS